MQNIDLMNLAGFCRNCLARWYQEAANERGIEMTKAQAREIYYGMPYDDWRPRTRPRPARTTGRFQGRLCENVGENKG